MAFGSPTSRHNAAFTSSPMATGSFTVTAGHMIVVVAQCNSLGALTDLSIADTQTLTWDPLIALQTTASGIAGGRGRIWGAISNGNATTVTVTPNDANIRGTLQVFSVGADNGVEFVQAKAASGDSTTASVTLDASPEADDWVFTGLFKNGTDGTTADGNCTELQEVATAAGQDCTGHTQYDAAGSDATITATWSGSALWDIVAVALRETAGGGGGELLTRIHAIEKV